MSDSGNSIVMPKSYPSLKIASLMILVLTTYYAYKGGFDVIKLDLGGEEKGGSFRPEHLLLVFSIFILFAATIEQACEVFLNMMTGEAEKISDANFILAVFKRKQAGEDLASAKNALTQKNLKTSEAGLDQANNRKSKLEVVQKQRSQILCVIMGCFVTLAGFQFLTLVLDTLGISKEQIENKEAWSAFDALATTLLLMGGADRFHQVAKDWFKGTSNVQKLIDEGLKVKPQGTSL